MPTVPITANPTTYTNNYTTTWINNWIYHTTVYDGTETTIYGHTIFTPIYNAEEYEGIIAAKYGKDHQDARE